MIRRGCASVQSICWSRVSITVLFYDNCALAQGITSLSQQSRLSRLLSVPGHVSLRTSTYVNGMATTFLLQSVVGRELCVRPRFEPTIPLPIYTNSSRMT